MRHLFPGARRGVQALLRQTTRQGWVVYSKRPFAGPDQVLAYLSRYTHRVGISNRRLLQLDRAAGTVAFDYKDYADGARHKPMELRLEEFIRRLRLHFLPPRFVKIRHYGLLANRQRQQRLERARVLLGVLGPPAPAAGSKPVAGPVRKWPVCPRCGWADADPGAGGAAATVATCACGRRQFMSARASIATGSGSSRFSRAAAGDFLVASPTLGAELTSDAHRERYPGIRQSWRSCLQAVAGPAPAVDSGAGGVPGRYSTL